MSFDTGIRLKAEREGRKLSQRQLAAAAGVTGGMISLIEQNRTSPSVATLKKILTALDVSLGDFFAEADAGPGQWHFAASDLRAVSPSPLIRFLQVGRSGDGPIQMLHETYAPGADTGPDLYSHDGDEAGIVIAGEVLLTVGGDTRLLAAGDAYLFQSRLPHRFRNPSQEPCVIVSACTPPTF